MKLSLAAKLLVCLGGLSMAAAAHLPLAPTTLQATAFHPRAGLDSERLYRWQGVLREANAVLLQSGSWDRLRPARARLVFRDGAWIDFEPSPSAVADGSLPPLLAVQFHPGRAPGTP